MKKIKEFLGVLILMIAILTAFFGSLIEASWLEPYCMITFVITLLYALFVRKVI